MNFRAISFWQLMASSVTVAPLSSNSSGTAVISFDLASAATCPKVSRTSLAEALTRCSAAQPAAVSNMGKRRPPEAREMQSFG